MLKRSGIFGILFIFLIAMALAGCSAGSGGMGNSGRAKSTASSPGAAQAPESAPDMDYSSGIAQDTAGETNDISLSIDPNRKLIRTGELEIESLDFEASLKALDLILSKLGGYIESSSITGVSKLSSGKQQMRNAGLTVRVPSKQFDAFLKESGSIGNVLRQTTGAQDVTDSYFDTEARLKSQQLMEQRLLDLLSKSDNVTDIVSLEKSLADTRYEIEKLTGTLRKWDALVEYSTFSVSIQEVMQISDLEPVTPQPTTLGEKIGASFVGSLEGVRDGFSAFLIFLAGALPYLVLWGVVIAVLGFVVVKIMGKHEKRWNLPLGRHKGRFSGKSDDGDGQDRK